MEQGTETEVQTQSTASASELLNLLSDNPASKPEVKTEEAPAAEVKDDAPAVVIPEAKPAEDGNISLEDEPAKEATGVVDDFETKYKERVSSDFGFDPDTIKTKLTAAPAQSTYKTELAKLADEMEVGTKMTQSDFFTYVATDHKALEPMALLDLKLRLEDPTLSADDRKAILEDKYKVYPDATPAETAIGKHAMNKDHKEALAEFEAKKANLKDALSTTAPKQEVQKVDVELQAKQAHWGKEAANVIKMLDKLPVTLKIPNPLDATKTEDLTINFDIPAKDKAAWQAFIEKNGAYMGLTSNEDMLAHVQKHFVAQYYPKLIQKATERAISKNNEEWTKIMANYQPPKGRTPSSVPTQKGSAKEYLGLLGVPN